MHASTSLHKINDRLYAGQFESGWSWMAGLGWSNRARDQLTWGQIFIAHTFNIHKCPGRNHEVTDRLWFNHRGSWWQFVSVSPSYLTLTAIHVKYLTYHKTVASKFVHLIDGVPSAQSKLTGDYHQHFLGSQSNDTPVSTLVSIPLVSLTTHF